jgi:hypothetical protein
VGVHDVCLAYLVEGDVEVLKCTKRIKNNPRLASVDSLFEPVVKFVETVFIPQKHLWTILRKVRQK